MDLRVRWRAGWIAIGLAAILTVVAFARPLSTTASPRMRLIVTLALGLGVAATALLASLRGRGLGERLAFYAFLVLAIDGLGQVVAAWAWPVWLLVFVLVGALAVAEPLRVAAGVAFVAALVGAADAFHGFATWQTVVARGFACLALALVVDWALSGEKRRLSATLAELARIKHGVDYLDPSEATGGGGGLGTAALTLRQVSEDARRARQAERAGELYASLGRLVTVARRALSAHALLYFEVDRERERAFLCAGDGPASLIPDCAIPLGQDPLAFVLDRAQVFYATDYKRLLWSLPYYRGEVRVGTLLAQPVCVGATITGVLIADTLDVQGFAGLQPELLASFGEIAAGMILEARASLGREELGAEFKAVYDVSQKLAVQTDPAPVRLLLLRSARDLVAHEMAALVSVDDAQTRYTVDDGSGWAKDYAGREVGLSERTWTAWVLRSAEEPYLLDDVQSGRERMPVLVLDEGLGRVESLLAIPMRVRNRTLGALVLGGRRGGFDASARRVLSILANQAAAALNTMRLVERAKDQALRDGLTELSNRRAFDDLLAKALAREQRQGGRLGLVFVDLDHFKKLNDTFGHPAGDAALKATAQVLERHLRKGDHAARYGGEEFAVILPGADEPGAVRLAERVRQAIQHQRLVFEDARLHFTASLGVAVSPTDGETEADLLAAADRALYAAKRAGRNRVMTASSAPADDVTSS